MLHRALVLTSLACCALLLASFALFAHDQAAGASARQQNELASTPAVSPSAAATNRPAGQPRRFIQGAADNLTAPFRSIVKSTSPWVNHGLPTLFGLIVYGVGLGFLARFSSGRA